MLLSQIAVDRILSYFAAGVTKRTSSIIDMAGWDGALFIADFSTIIEAGTIDVAVEQNTSNSPTGMARLATTTAHTVTAAQAALTASCIVVDVYRPQEQYLQAFITPAAQNAVITGITAIRYMKNGKMPVTQAANVLKSTKLVSPAQA